MPKITLLQPYYKKKLQSISSTIDFLKHLLHLRKIFYEGKYGKIMNFEKQFLKIHLTHKVLVDLQGRNITLCKVIFSEFLKDNINKMILQGLSKSNYSVRCCD